MPAPAAIDELCSAFGLSPSSATCCCCARASELDAGVGGALRGGAAATGSGRTPPSASRSRRCPRRTGARSRPRAAAPLAADRSRTTGARLAMTSALADRRAGAALPGRRRVPRRAAAAPDRAVAPPTGLPRSHAAARRSHRRSRGRRSQRRQLAGRAARRRRRRRQARGGRGMLPQRSGCGLHVLRAADRAGRACRAARRSRAVGARGGADAQRAADRDATTRTTRAATRHVPTFASQRCAAALFVERARAARATRTRGVAALEVRDPPAPEQRSSGWTRSGAEPRV